MKTEHFEFSCQSPVLPPCSYVGLCLVTKAQIDFVMNDITIKMITALFSNVLIAGLCKT